MKFSRIARTTPAAGLDARPHRNYNRKNVAVGLKLTRVGNSVGVVLPKDVLARLNLELGDTIYLTESPDGYRITPYNADFERQFEAARNVMKKDRAILRELAK